MPKLTRKIPQLSRHVSGHAFVKIDGQQIWLGRYGEPTTQEAYDRLVAGWLANGRRLPAPAAVMTAPSVRRIIADYFTWASARYSKPKLQAVRSSLRIVEQLFGSEPALQFGPRALRLVRQEMIRKGWSRRNINGQISNVRSVFKWAAGQELLDVAIYRRLATVEPLQRGEAPEAPRVKPVPRRHIRVTRRYLTKPVRAMVDLQLLTGSRADQITRLRAADIDRSGPVWRMQPEDHKTAHHDKDLVILFGPRAQRILRMFIDDRDEEAFLFSPRESNAQSRRLGAVGARRPNQKPSPRQTQRKMGDHFTTASYRRQIHRACQQALSCPPGLRGDARKQWRREHQWSPHRLRHNAATTLRRQFGVEIASIILGHSSLPVTALYAERNLARAVEVIGQVG
jgi:integrase